MTTPGQAESCPPSARQSGTGTATTRSASGAVSFNTVNSPLLTALPVTIVSMGLVSGAKPELQATQPIMQGWDVSLPWEPANEATARPTLASVSTAADKATASVSIVPSPSSDASFNKGSITGLRIAEVSGEFVRQSPLRGARSRWRCRKRNSGTSAESGPTAQITGARAASA